MMDRLRLENFKCFSDLNLALAPLTLLCGLNGMGKSSVIQSLLVLRQSFLAGDLDEGRVVLSGDLVDLGTGADALFEDAEKDILSFELSRPSLEPFRISFDYIRDADQLAAQTLGAPSSREIVPIAWRQLPPFSRSVTYIGAERLGPRKLYLASSSRARSGYVGPRSEFSLSFLLSCQDEVMLESDPRVLGPSCRVIDVLDEWLQIITPGAHLELEAIQAADALIAGFKFDRSSDVSSRRYRATNVGFGLSYVLPVLISLITASPESLVLIENPEAHLHPRGQTRLGELAALAASAGIQVIAETHSDHFMDGVRIAVRDKVIQPREAAFHFFSRTGASTRVTSPTVDMQGTLSDWPQGFFDQHEENLVRLLAKPS